MINTGVFNYVNVLDKAADAAWMRNDAISNNIANVATTGFKSSRAEFADVYTTSVMANGRTTVGSGVQTAVISQQFAQGVFQSSGSSSTVAAKAATQLIRTHRVRKSAVSFFAMVFSSLFYDFSL